MADNNLIRMLHFPEVGSVVGDRQEKGGELKYLLEGRAMHPLAHEVRELLVNMLWFGGRCLRREEAVFVDRIVYPYYFVSRADQAGLEQHTKRGIAAIRRGDSKPWFVGTFDGWMRNDFGHRARTRLVPILHRDFQNGEIAWKDVQVFVRISARIISLLVLPEEVRDLPKFNGSL